MSYSYYYNNVPGIGQCRNNLIYTSLMSDDKKTFVKWYHNDTDYHKGMNEVVDPEKMQEKWDRELQYIYLMSKEFPDLVPNIREIDLINKKIYLEVDGDDFWEQSGCLEENYNNILPDWQEQMLEIIKAHRSLNLYKFSMHPSSYFIVDGKLKSINYFFTYSGDEETIKISDVLSHISSNRRLELQKYSESKGISWDEPTPLQKAQILCFDSFSNNYPIDFINKAKEIYA
jgi:hypothetical protein